MIRKSIDCNKQFDINYLDPITMWKRYPLKKLKSMGLYYYVYLVPFVLYTLVRSLTVVYFFHPMIQKLIFFMPFSVLEIGRQAQNWYVSFL